MIVVAAAVVRERPGAKVLLTRRREGQHLAGFWEFPGGKVEEGEDPEAAVVRECLEEIAVTLDVVDILEVAWHRYAEKEVLLLFYDCRLVSGEIEDLEVAEHAWVDIDRLADYPPPAARRAPRHEAPRRSVRRCCDARMRAPSNSDQRA